MLNFEVLQGIVDSPPATVLELYSRLCEAHSYTYGDVTRVGTVYHQSVANPTTDVFVQVSKPSADTDAILATIFVGKTVDEVTTYDSRLGIFLRASGDAQATLLATQILGKALGQHIAEAMGYDDYIVIRALSNTVVGIEGTAGSAWIMPLVLPPGISFHSADPLHYVEAGWSQNVDILNTLVLKNNSARMSANVNTRGNNIKPSAWFYISNSYDGAVLPLNVYITDDQCWATVNDKINAMQQAKIGSMDGDIAQVGGNVETLTLAFAGVADLVGTLSVFGNSVKEVTTKYNNVTQYIPRP